MDFDRSDGTFTIVDQIGADLTERLSLATRLHGVANAQLRRAICAHPAVHCHSAWALKQEDGDTTSQYFLKVAQSGSCRNTSSDTSAFQKMVFALNETALGSTAARVPSETLQDLSVSTDCFGQPAGVGGCAGWGIERDEWYQLKKCMLDLALESCVRRPLLL